jgi:hypothetical protein
MPYEVVGRTIGAYTASNGSETADPSPSKGPWGPALSLPTNSRDVYFAGRGLTTQSVAALGGLTLFYAAKGQVQGFHEAVIGTSSNVNGNGGLFYGGGGFAFAVSFNGAGEVRPAITPPTTAWYATAASIDFTVSPISIKFYIYNYETGAFSSDTQTTTFGLGSGDGVALIGPVAGTASGGLLLLAAAGYATRAWSRADFTAWMADPFAPVRPRASRLATILAGTLPPPGGPMFRRSLYRRTGSRGVA